MTYEWIKAPLALRYVAVGQYDYPTKIRICERAHGGLIAAKADKVIWGTEEHKNLAMPKEFWWAEGQEALEQDWETGDFSTWIDRKVEVKAFGVSFDFLAISNLVSADKQADAMRSISVVAESDWISSYDLVRLMYQKHSPTKVSEAMLEATRLGLIAGRAMRALGEGNGKFRDSSGPKWAAIEWDIPLWFWRSFTEPGKSNFDWQLGKVKGDGIGPNGRDSIELQGVHFHRSGLPNLGLTDASKITSSNAGVNRGPKPKYDWQKATNAIWGQIYRAELIPKNQAQIERALQACLAKGDDEPSESTVRPFAKQIWEEYSRADNSSPSN